MPRAPQDPDDTHREEQRRYREQLAQRRVPEVGRVDTAVAAAVYASLREAGFARDVRRREMMKSIVARATTALLAQGFDPEGSRRVVVRRLAGPNPRFEDMLKAAPGKQDDDRPLTT